MRGRPDLRKDAAHGCHSPRSASSDLIPFVSVVAMHFTARFVKAMAVEMRSSVSSLSDVSLFGPFGIMVSHDRLGLATVESGTGAPCECSGPINCAATSCGTVDDRSSDEVVSVLRKTNLRVFGIVLQSELSLAGMLAFGRGDKKRVGVLIGDCKRWREDAA